MLFRLPHPPLICIFCCPFQSVFLTSSPSVSLCALPSIIIFSHLLSPTTFLLIYLLSPSVSFNLLHSQCVFLHLFLRLSLSLSSPSLCLLRHGSAKGSGILGKLHTEGFDRRQVSCDLQDISLGWACSIRCTGT